MSNEEKKKEAMAGSHSLKTTWDAGRLKRIAHKETEVVS